MFSVLFVCAANVCRSPMAMGILRLLTAGEEGWRIESAGVWALTGASAAPLTVQLLAERQVDLSGHRARQVERSLLSEFQVILVMEKNQREALRLAFPDLAQRIILLSELIGESFDIPDPIGSGLSEFETTYHEIENILRGGLSRLRELAWQKDDNSADGPQMGWRSYQPPDAQSGGPVE